MIQRLFVRLVLTGVVLVSLSTLGPVAKLAAPAAPVEVSSASDPVIAAAGDIACDPKNSNFNAGNGSSGSCRQRYVSDLLVNTGLAAVLLLGDNQYYCGGYDAFLQSYDTSWGRVKDITHPAVGNHEYITSSGSDRTGCDSSNAGAAGHFRYFGAAAGDPTKGYYSFEIGTWHLIMLNSSCGDAGGCSSSTSQGQWLRADLAAHPSYCTLAFWHTPLFSSGGRASSASRTFWDALYAADADLVLSGHDHTYERFAPQTPSGARDDARGIREFVVGTGGANHTSMSSVKPNSEVRNDSTFGALKLTLHPTSYEWQFVPEAGKTFTDSGTGQCHGKQNDTLPPTAPTDLSGLAATPGKVSLTWTASSDNVAVLGYRVFRAGTELATTTGTTFVDATAQPGTTRGYTVAAYDAGGNQSGMSNTATVTTAADTTAPTAPTKLTAPTVAADHVDLTWSASSDDVAVDHYVVLRDGLTLGSPTTTGYSDATVGPLTAYTYRVLAVDRAGNTSAASDVLNLATPAAPTVLTFQPADDTDVREDQPTANFASAAVLHADGSPNRRSFLRFSVSGVAGRPVTSAKLRLHCLDPSDVGGRFHRITTPGWTASSVTWNAQPAYDSAVLASLGSVTAGNWYEVELKALITQDGTYEIAVDSASTNGADYDSSEGTGGAGPSLVLTMG